MCAKTKRRWNTTVSMVTIWASLPLLLGLLETKKNYWAKPHVEDISRLLLCYIMLWCDFRCNGSSDLKSWHVCFLIGGKSKSVELEDVKFHQCVRLSRFENDRTISFIPPDGEFELMSYRLNTHVSLDFWIWTAAVLYENNLVCR